MPYVPVGVIGNRAAVRDLRQFASAMDVTATRLQSSAARGGLALDAMSAKMGRLQAQMVGMSATAAAGLGTAATGAAGIAARASQIGGYAPMMIGGRSPQVMKRGFAQAADWRPGMMTPASAAAAGWLTRGRPAQVTMRGFASAADRAAAGRFVSPAAALAGGWFGNRGAQVTMRGFSRAADWRPGMVGPATGPAQVTMRGFASAADRAAAGRFVSPAAALAGGWFGNRGAQVTMRGFSRAADWRPGMVGPATGPAQVTMRGFASAADRAAAGRFVSPAAALAGGWFGNRGAQVTMRGFSRAADWRPGMVGPATGPAQVTMRGFASAADRAAAGRFVSPAAALAGGWFGNRGAQVTMRGFSRAADWRPGMASPTGRTANFMTAAAAQMGYRFRSERELWRATPPGPNLRSAMDLPGKSVHPLQGLNQPQNPWAMYARNLNAQRQGFSADYRTQSAEIAARRARGMGGMGAAGMMAMGGMRGMGGMGGGAGGAAAVERDGSGLPRVFGTMGRTGMRLGLTMTGATLALFAFMGVVRGVTSTYSKFEDELVGSMAIMRDLTDQQRSQLGAQARVAALGTRFTAPDSAAAEYFLASAGYSPEGVLQAHPVITTGAQAARMPIPRFGELATDVTRSAGRWVHDDETATTANLQKTIDQVLHLSRLTDATPEQIFSSLTQLSGIGDATGQPFEQMLGLTGVLANVGQKSSTSRDLGVQLINRLAQMGSDPNRAEAFKKHGISVFDKGGDFRMLSDIVGNFESVAEGKTDEEFNRMLQELGFGAKSARPMRLLLGETSEYIRLVKEAGRATGAAAEIAAEQLTSLGARWDLTKSKMEDSAIALGTAWLPGLSEGLGMVDLIAGGIHSWSVGIENASRDLTHYGETLKRIRDMEGLEPGLTTFPSVEGDVPVLVEESGQVTPLPRAPDLNRRVGETMGDLGRQLGEGWSHPWGPGGMIGKLFGDPSPGTPEQIQRMLPVTQGDPYGADLTRYGLDIADEQWDIARELQKAVDKYEKGGHHRWMLQDMIPDRKARQRLLRQYREYNNMGQAPAADEDTMDVPWRVSGMGLGVGFRSETVDMAPSSGGGRDIWKPLVDDMARYISERFPSALSQSMSTAISEVKLEPWSINKFVSDATGQVADAMAQIHGQSDERGSDVLDRLRFPDGVRRRRRCPDRGPGSGAGRSVQSVRNADSGDAGQHDMGRRGRRASPSPAGAGRYSRLRVS